MASELARRVDKKEVVVDVSFNARPNWGCADEHWRGATKCSAYGRPTALPIVSHRSLLAAYFQNYLSSAVMVFLPSQGNYTQETTQRWNAFSAPTYVVSVKSTSDRDVETIVGPLMIGEMNSWCDVLQQRYRLIISPTDCVCLSKKHPFLGSDDGHDYPVTLDTVQNDMEIDLGHFQTFSINSRPNTITVGGSIHFANITGPLYDASKEWRKSTYDRSTS